MYFAAKKVSYRIWAWEGKWMWLLVVGIMVCWCTRILLGLFGQFNYLAHLFIKRSAPV